MFKLFRKYQFWLLAVGGTLLMCVFLVQGALPSFFQPNQAAQVIGTIHGGNEKLTLGDERDADADLHVLVSLSPLLAESEGNQATLRWLLLVHAAKSLGLDTSDATVAKIQGDLGLSQDENARAQKARSLGVSISTLDRAVRDWDTVQQYKELVLGLGHISAEERVQRLAQAMYIAQLLGGRSDAYDVNRMISNAIEGSRGTMRVSQPLLTRLLQESLARVKITAVGVPAERYLPQVKSVAPEELSSLFAQYHDHYPGQPDDQGYTLGYKTPDRVKIEYLTIPFARLRAAVKIDETEIITYYQAHRDELQPPSKSDAAPPPASPEVPDDMARAKIVDILTQQHTEEQAQHIIKIAGAMLSDEVRNFKDDEGYRQLPANWQPMTLEWVAQQVQQQTGVLPEVTRIGDRWLDLAALRRLPGIGQATVDGAHGAPMTAYVQSARDFSPNATNALAILRLQTLVASQPLTGPDGSKYLFRLIAAQPAHSPQSLDEPGVKEEVLRDAKLLDAYKLLLADRARWQAKLKTKSLTTLSQELDEPLLTPPPFARRESSQAGMVAPFITGIGRDAGFADAAFTLAVKAASQGPIDATPPAQRSDAIPANASLSLYLVRIDAFDPLTHSQYDQFATNPSIGVRIEQILANGKDTDALSLETLEKQLDYKSTGENKPKEESKPETPSGPATPDEPIGG